MPLNKINIKGLEQISLDMKDYSNYMNENLELYYRRKLCILL